MSLLALSDSFENLCYRSTVIINILILLARGDRLYTSESDVYRRQILTYKDGLSTERVKMGLLVALRHIRGGAAV